MLLDILSDGIADVLNEAVNVSDVRKVPSRNRLDRNSQFRRSNHVICKQVGGTVSMCLTKSKLG